METTMNEIFLVACIIIFWLFPVIGILKRHKIGNGYSRYNNGYKYYLKNGVVIVDQLSVYYK